MENEIYEHPSFLINMALQAAERPVPQYQPPKEIVVEVVKQPDPAELERQRQQAIIDKMKGEMEKKQEFQKKIEKMVAEKMKKGGRKKVEKTVETIVKKQDIPKKCDLTHEHENEVEDSVLGKHTRFWEVEKRIQEHREKYNYSLLDSSSPQDISSNRSYITALRSRLLGLPSVTHDHSMIEKNPDGMKSIVFGNGAKSRNRSSLPKTVDNSLFDDQHEASWLIGKNGKFENEFKLPKLSESPSKNEQIQPFITNYDDSPYGKILPEKYKAKIRRKQKLVHSPKQKVDRYNKEGETGERSNIIGDVGQTTEENELTTTAENTLSLNNTIRQISSKELFHHQDQGIEQYKKPVRDTSKKSVKTRETGKLSEPDINKTVLSKSNITNTHVTITSGTSSNVSTGSSNLLRSNPQKRSNYYMRSIHHFMSHNATPTENKDKRNASVIAEVNESGAATLRVPKTTKEIRSYSVQKRANNHKLDSGSLVRQIFRVQNLSRQSSSPEIREENTSPKQSLVNKNYFKQVIKRARNSGDYLSTLEKKGCSFTTSPRSFLKTDNPSPGPKYDLSSYRGILSIDAGLKLQSSIKKSKKRFHTRPPEEFFKYLARPREKVKTIQIPEEEYKDTWSQPMREIPRRSPKGAHFGTSKRNAIFNARADIPGPGDYDIALKMAANGVAFGKEKKTFGSIFPELKDMKHTKLYESKR